jgi:hypothetical protein
VVEVPGSWKLGRQPEPPVLIQERRETSRASLPLPSVST